MADPCIEIISTFESLVQEHGGDDLVKEFRAMSKGQRDKLADEIIGEMDIKTRQAKLTAAAWDSVVRYLDDTKSAKDMRKAFADYNAGHGVRMRGIDSLERRTESIFHGFTATMAEGLEKYQRRFFGLTHSKLGQGNIIDELYVPGVSGDKDAVAFATIYKKSHDALVTLFNRAGGDIKRLPTYNLPQFHDSIRIRGVDKKEWLDFVKGLIHTDRLVYKRTEEGLQSVPVSNEVMDEMLGRVYDNLASGGVIHKELATNPHVRRMLGKHHQEHRVLHFKDSESWKAYADKFGASDYVQSMLAQAQLMSREIAAMQKYGPNADMLVRKARLHVQKASGDRNAGRLGEAIYEQIMNRTPVNNTVAADVMRGVRNISVGIKIGKAVISAVSDLGFFGLTNFYNGMPVMRGYLNFIGSLATGGKAGRTTAAHVNLGARYAIDNAQSAYRVAEVMGVGTWTGRFADVMVKASGLNYWTNVARQQYGLNTLHRLGELINRPFNNLNPKIQRMFRKYGISSDNWDAMRAVPLYEQEGARYLNPGAFADEELTHKIIGAVMEETDFAIPEPGAKAMTLLRGGSAAGTIPGEITRSMGMFKSFATSVIVTHWLRALNMAPANGLAYFASLLLGTTALGAVAIQAKQIVDGKTPMEMDRAFWSWAFLQGGGTGIMGDFIFQDHTRVGSLSEFALGPLAGDASIVLGLTLGTANDFITARDKIGEKLGARAARSIDKLAPNLWQTNLLLKRYLTDHIQYLVNPNWQSQQRTMERRIRKERGQNYWWEPRELTPGA